MKKAAILISVILLTAFSMTAQQDPHFTMYMFNKQMINPAYAGAREALSISGLYRNQWVGLDGAPKTINAGIHSPVSPDNESRVALGLLVFNDQIGVSNTFGLYGQYAYRLPVSEKTKLSLGIQGGFSTYTGRFSELTARDGISGDGSINEDIISSLLPNLGFGAYLYHDNYYLGFSIPRLMQNKYDPDAIPSNNTDVARQLRHYFLMGGVVLPLSDDVKIRPNLILKYITNPGKNIAVPFDADFNLSVMFFDRVLLGASYRLEDSFDAIFEVQITNMLRFGYAYDFTVSALDPYNKGTHEIMIGYDISTAIKAYTTPRFIKYF